MARLGTHRLVATFALVVAAVVSAAPAALASSHKGTGCVQGTGSGHGHGKGHGKHVKTCNAAATLAISPASADFGSTVPGTQSSVITFTLSNAGGHSTSALKKAISGPGAADFSIVNDQCRRALSKGRSCTLGVQFHPSGFGASSATLTVRGANKRLSVTATLTGTGNELAISPASNDFGSTLTGGSSRDATFTVTNTGTSTTGALATAVSGANASEFVVGTDTCNGQTVAGGATCSVTVHMAPTTAGAKAATVTVSGSPGGAASASLTGTGVTLSLDPATHDFGASAAKTADTTFTVSNPSGGESGIPAVTLGGADAASFTIDASTCTATLPAGGTCTVQVAFNGGAAGVAFSASLDVSATPGGSATSALQGQGA